MRMTNRSPFARANRPPRASENEIFIYDEIGFFGIQAEDFVRTLNAMDSDTIHLRINSPGGSVFDGQAMITAIRQHPANVVAHVDGLAASMASGIAVASDDVHMAEGSFLMIHNPWSIVLGDAEAMRHEADLLEKVSGQLANNYARRSGKPRDEIDALMAAETWFTADEAVEAGLADVVDAAPAREASFDLSVFSNVPERLKGAQREPTERELERLLRDVGFSRAAAKAFVAEGRKALTQRDVGEEAPEDLAALERWVKATQALVA